MEQSKKKKKERKERRTERDGWMETGRKDTWRTDKNTINVRAGETSETLKRNKWEYRVRWGVGGAVCKYTHGVEEGGLESHQEFPF